MRRALLVACLVAVVSAVIPSLAMGETCPPYEGAYMFTTIHSAEDPEDYCWEVNLNEGQELEQVNDQQIAVKSKTGATAWEINAQPARDAEGTAVPTSIALTGEREFTYTVHHRAGNPAAGGAPFVYPISEGPSYETGFATVIVKMPPPTEQPPPSAPPTPTCEVPVLQGRTLKAARRALLAADCQLGPVRGHRHPGARIVKQYRPAYRVLPASTEVGVKLGR